MVASNLGPPSPLIVSRGVLTAGILAILLSIGIAILFLVEDMQVHHQYDGWATAAHIIPWFGLCCLLARQIGILSEEQWWVRMSLVFMLVVMILGIFLSEKTDWSTYYLVFLIVSYLICLIVYQSCTRRPATREGIFQFLFRVIVMSFIINFVMICLRFIQVVVDDSNDGDDDANDDHLAFDVWNGTFVILFGLLCCAMSYMEAYGNGGGMIDDDGSGIHNNRYESSYNNMANTTTTTTTSAKRRQDLQGNTNTSTVVEGTPV